MPIKAVILCGGHGTRIRGVADDIPKPMVPIGDRPILWHIMKGYAHFGLRDFILCLGHKGWIIKEFFLNYKAFASDFTVALGVNAGVQFHNGVEDDWRVTLAETGEDTQTGGRLWQARKYLEGTDAFCIAYGDGVADIDIQRLIQFHKAHGRVVTVTGVRPPGRFGVMDTLQSDGLFLVDNFEEKPQTTEGRINGGFFVADHRLWDYLNGDPQLIFEREPLARLARDGELVMYPHDGFWQPMDTYREWRILNDLWTGGKPPWRVWR